MLTAWCAVEGLQGGGRQEKKVSEQTMSMCRFVRTNKLEREYKQRVAEGFFSEGPPRPVLGTGSDNQAAPRGLRGSTGIDQMRAGTPGVALGLPAAAPSQPSKPPALPKKTAPVCGLGEEDWVGPDQPPPPALSVVWIM